MKTDRQPTEEQKAAAAAKRAELCRRCAPLRPYAEANTKARLAVAFEGLTKQEAETKYLAAVPPAFRWLPTLNACLEVIYREETGQQEFHTFRDWKAKGFAVRKGEHGFTLWSTPKPFEVDAGTLDANGDPEKKTVDRFALAHVFHAGQVRRIEAPAEKTAEQRTRDFVAAAEVQITEERNRRVVV